MSSIADRMSNLVGGKHSGGIASRMEGREEKHDSEGEHDGVEEHLKALHEKMGGKLHLAHQHEGGYTTHHVKEDGKVEGAHDHENTEELKHHMDRFFDEEEHEPRSENHDDLM